VVAFEPARDNFALLWRNIESNACEDRVVAVQAALSDRRGQGVLQLSGDNLGDHVLYADGTPRRNEAVTLVPGAEALAAHMDRIDVLKIDTQGTELAVLRGLAPLLEASRATVSVLVELTPAALRRAGDSGAALITALEALGLPLFIVDHAEHRVVPESAVALRRWSDNVDATEGDEGFMNIFAGRLPAGF
jgi:FkbM family methyltransferase